MAILRGLCRATGAAGCTVTVQLLPQGESAAYSHGTPCEGDTLSIELGVPDMFHGTCELCDAGRGPAASPAAIEAMRPMLDGALAALIEHSSARRQVDLLAGILEAANEATLVIDRAGDILYANPKGDELLDLHTEKPMAQISQNSEAAPLLHLVQHEISRVAQGAATRHQTVTLGDGSTWTMEIIALSGSPPTQFYLVVLSPIRFPDPHELEKSLAPNGISRREAGVIAYLLRGKRTGEIAEAMGITEYTVKDHLKHIYAKFDVTSRAKLLAHLAASGVTGGRTTSL